MYYVLSSLQILFLHASLLAQTNKKEVIKNQCNLGTRMIKFQNAGLRAPRKISLGSGLQSQKRIRAPVSKMIGLRALKQKFQGSGAPGTPPLRPWLIAPLKSCSLHPTRSFFCPLPSHDKRNSRLFGFFSPSVVVTGGRSHILFVSVGYFVSVVSVVLLALVSF